MKKIVIRFNAPVILAFALLSLLALLLGKWTDGAATYQYFSVYRASLSDPLTYVRFFGHVLGHADYEHYMGNMLLILLVGPGLEEKYGSGTMVWTIAVTALVTGLVHFVFFPGSVLLGASGVVFMMIVLSSFTAMRRGGDPHHADPGGHLLSGRRDHGRPFQAGQHLPDHPHRGRPVRTGIRLYHPPGQEVRGCVLPSSSRRRCWCSTVY